MGGLFDRFRRRRLGRYSPQPDVPTTDPDPHPEVFPSGIKLLHTPGGGAAVDIVFVHGLKGHRERTWTARDATEPWPKTLLPTKIPNARVLTFGYDASVVDWKSAVSESRIGNHSVNLLTSLANFRDSDDTNKQPIIFVCHSMGGLVCEDALVSSRHHSEAHLRAIFDSTKGIVFFGTPHRGSGLANWAEKLSMSIGVVKLTNTNLVRVLRRDSEVLARIQDSFHNMMKVMSKEGKEAIEITCFYEELPLPTVGLVVPQDSAILPGYIAIGIRNDHHGMTKFISAEDPGLVAVCAELRRWIKGISTAQSRQGAVLRAKTDEADVVLRKMPTDVKGNFFVPFTQNLDFIGRSDILTRLKQEFAHDQKKQKGKGRSRVSIHGLGGVGKTQVALAYAYWLREVRPDISIFWVYSSSKERFQQAFANIAEEYDIPGHKNPSVNILSLVKTWPQKEKNGPWFLVIDNADDPDLFFPQDRAASAADSGSTPNEANIGLAQFIPQCSHGSILITTRNKQAGLKLAPGRPPTEVGKMTDSESAQMIRKMTGYEDLGLETTSTLSNRLGNLPLALAQASAFILENSITVEDYLTLLDKDDESIVPLLSEVFQTTDQDGNVPQAVMMTWMISFEQIKSQNELASELLSTIAFYDSQGITRSMLDIRKPPASYEYDYSTASRSADSSLTDSYRRPNRHRHIDYDETDSEKEHSITPELSATINFTQESPVNLGAPRPIINAKTPSITLDGTKTTEKQRDEESLGAKDANEKQLEEGDPFQRWEPTLPLEWSLDAAQAPPLYHLPLEADLWVRSCSLHVGVSSKALDTFSDDPTRLIGFEKALGILKAFSFISEGNDKTISVHRLVQLATKEWLTRRGLSKTFLEKALGAFVTTFPIAVYERMGICKQLLPHAHTILRYRVVEYTHSVLLEAVLYENLARFYFNTGQSEVAMRLLQHALGRAIRTLSEGNMLVLQMIRMLAVSFSNLGRSTEAKQLLSKLVLLGQRSCPDQHPQMLRVVSALAGQCYIDEEYDEAKRLLTDAVEACDRDYRGLVCIKVELLVQLARVLVSSGDLEEAETKTNEVIQIIQKTSCYKVDHPISLKNFRTQSIVFRKQGRLGEAEATCRTVLEGRDVLSDHAQSYLLLIMEELSHVLFEQSRLPEAEEMQARIMEIQAQTAGYRHEGASIGMAYTSHTMGSVRIRAGQYHREQVFDTSARYFDSSHQEAITRYRERRGGDSIIYRENTHW